MRKCIVLAVALIAGVTFRASAEVNDIKVSGSLSTVAFNRSFDLGGNVDAAGRGIASYTKLRFDVDLSENVAAVIKMQNERVWGMGEATGNDSTDIDLELAYVQFSEFLGMPATFTLGRQCISIGNGYLMRNGNDNTAIFAGMASGLDDHGACDGALLQLDFDPITVDLFFEKITKVLLVYVMM